MNSLVDKLAIIMLCLIGFSMSDNFAAPVIGLLIAAAASSAVQLFSGKAAAAVIILLCSAVCGIFPLYFCALPLMLYDAMCEKKIWAVLPSLTVLFKPGELSYEQLLITFAGMVTAVIIYHRISKLEESVKELTSLRDEIAEKNMRLAEQNICIAEAQDNEIHLAALRERNRIAREIHDNVGHMLTRSLLQSGALIAVNKDAALAEPLTALKATLDSAMNGIRESVHNIRDDSFDLKNIISESINSVDKRFCVKLDYDAGDDIPGKIKLCVAGVVKEGLSNAVKHSNGDRITVIFREHPGFYQLMIDDNGCCKLSSAGEGGMGLKNMEERADSVGGRISFTSSEKGFRIFMSVPKVT